MPGGTDSSARGLVLTRCGTGREKKRMPHPTNPPLLGSSIFATTHGASAHTKAMPTINCISSSDDPIEGELTDVVLISRDRLQNPFLQWKETVESE